MRYKIYIFLLFLFVSDLASAQTKTINVLSYNIRLNIAQDSINAWPNRKENVKALIDFHDIDILGVQEALPDQFEFLSGISRFEAFGVGRDDGNKKGEFSALFYNKHRFIKRDGGTFWLSPIPEVVGKGWDAAYNRICTWLKLYDKHNKKEFLIFNTHYDHRGLQARIQSSQLLKEKIQSKAGNLPVIFMGDLNSTPETEAIAVIKSFLNDTKEISKEPAYGPEGTFNGFNFNSPLKERIDYIFVNQSFNVFKYGVLTDHKDQRYFSDHLPVYVRLGFK